MSNIVDVVVADKNLATMSKSVRAAGLETELEQTGPFTVFAPTEIAFGKLHEGELAGWLKPENKIRLRDILHNHMVAGKTNFKDFKDGQILKTLNDKELVLKVNGSVVTVNGARVQTRDNEASNGVVHSLDAVVIPPVQVQ